jgi:formylglycine-generating enzyme required for sulfatase activity
MKKILLIMLVCLLALAGCKDEKDEPTPDKNAIESFTVNGVSFNMVKLKGGSLTMNMELPLTPTVVLYQDSTLDVTLADYSIGQTEVTQALWQAVMGNNPSYFSSNEIFMVEKEGEFEDDLNRPVEWVSWDDCQAFIEKLNELTGRHFRIPTEAEWEFAARGGNETHGYPYAGSDNIDDVAWCLGNTDNMTHPVGQKKPNELGLYDMSGNVREWCLDRISFRMADGTSYAYRIVRGGSYYQKCFVWYRDRATQNVKGSDLGLRLAM